jgi:hypothetical protein
LDGFTSESVDGEDAEPVPWYTARADKDQVPGCVIEEDVVDGRAGTVSDSGEHGAAIEAQAVEGEVEEEPGEGGAEEGFEMRPLFEIVVDVGPGGGGLGEMVADVLFSFLLGDRVHQAFLLPVHVRFDVGVGFFDVVRDVEGVARGFGDRDAVVQREAGWDGAEAYDDAPCAVGGELADGVAAGEGARGVDEGFAEADGSYEGDECSSKLPGALHGEYCCHHSTAPTSWGESKKISISIHCDTLIYVYGRAEESGPCSTSEEGHCSCENNPRYPTSTTHQQDISKRNRQLTQK